MSKCSTCGRPAGRCICPACPRCGEAGNSYCYSHGYLQYTKEQIRGQSLALIASLKTKIKLEEEFLKSLDDMELRGDIENRLEEG
jgi:predicted amidophosphoribosyltransferase